MQLSFFELCLLNKKIWSVSFISFGVWGSSQATKNDGVRVVFPSFSAIKLRFFLPLSLQRLADAS